MSLLCKFYQTTIGKKIIMAVSGLIFVGFVIGHMLGNLKFFFPTDVVTGQYAIDHYAEFLKMIAADLIGKENFLWLARIVLLGSLIAHVSSAIQLAIINKKARQAKYAMTAYSSSTAASRTMLYGGLFLLSFIVFHILHFTTGDVHFQSFEYGKVYANVYNGFAVWYVALFYVMAMGALSMHLYHGTWSMFQTLGVDNPKWNGGIRTIAKLVAIVLFIGFCSLPISSYFKLVDAPKQYSMTYGD